MEKFENQMLTPQEVSQLIKISVGTLENWRMQGRGPKFIKLGGGQIGRASCRERVASPV